MDDTVAERMRRREPESSVAVPHPMTTEDAGADIEGSYVVGSHAKSRRKTTQLLLRWVLPALVLVILGSAAGVVAVRVAPPSYAASSQVLVRDRDYAAIVLGTGATPSTGTSQRTIAAQVLAAKAPSFTDEVARRAGVPADAVSAGLTVTASPDADVVVFSVTARAPQLAVRIADVSAELEVSRYRDHLVMGLGSAGTTTTLDPNELRVLAQAQAFERISPSAQVLATAGAASGGPISVWSGALTGAAAGAIVAMLALAAEHFWRERARGRRASTQP